MGGEKEIARRVEVEFERFLKKRFPNAEIECEPQTFYSKGHHGQGATPDFKIIFPNGRTAFVEITTRPQKAGDNLADPKSHQKKVMEEQTPHTPFLVFYREQLIALQDKQRYRHLNLRFFPNGNGHRTK